MIDRCVVCGADISDSGRMVCKACEEKIFGELDDRCEITGIHVDYKRAIDIPDKPTKKKRKLKLVRRDSVTREKK